MTMDKKNLLVALALICSLGAVAQDKDSGGGVSVTAFLGMNVSGVHDHLLYEDSKAGGTMGVKLDCFLPKGRGTYLSAGLDWTQKGAKEPIFVSNDFGVKATAKLSLHYLEIPVRVGFLYDLTESFALYAEAGPYVAVGVGGKNRLSIDAEGKQWEQMEDEMSTPAFGKDRQEASFRRLDAGLGFRVGTEFRRHFNVMLGCDWGLTDMWRKDYLDYLDETGGKVGKCRNFSFTLAVGYRF